MPAASPWDVYKGQARGVRIRGETVELLASDGDEEELPTEFSRVNVEEKTVESYTEASEEVQLLWRQKIATELVHNAKLCNAGRYICISLLIH